MTIALVLSINCSARSLAACCPLRNERYPVSPAISKVVPTKGPTIIKRSGICMVVSGIRRVRFFSNIG